MIRFTWSDSTGYIFIRCCAWKTHFTNFENYPSHTHILFFLTEGGLNLNWISFYGYTAIHVCFRIIHKWLTELRFYLNIEWKCYIFRKRWGEMRRQTEKYCLLRYNSSPLFSFSNSLPLLPPLCHATQQVTNNIKRREWLLMIRTHIREGEIAKYNTLKVIQTLCFYKFFNNLGSLRSGEEWQEEE